MDLQDALRATAAQFLNPGEKIEEVFRAQTRSPVINRIAGLFGVLGVLIAASFTELRIVTVTDQRILILDAGRWTGRKARGVVEVLPRATRLGPATGTWHRVEIPSGKLWVHRRFHNEVDTADAMIGFAAN